jgi:cobalt/nickel transport system permease protein
VSHIDTSANLNRWRKKSLAEKALLAIGMLLLAVALPSWPADVLVAVIMILATVAGARVPFTLWWKAMTAPIGFLVLAVLTLLFQVRAFPFSIGFAPHGLALAFRLGLRAFAGLTCLLFLALTTPAADLTGGLRRIGVPAEIVEMALLMYRFVFLLTDTAEAMNAAQAARLGHITYRSHMKSLSLLIVNLMPRAFARAQALEVGLAARGWAGELRVLSPVRPASPRWIGAILAIEAVVLLIGLHPL